MDLIGLDTALHIGNYNIYGLTKEPHYKPPITSRKLVLSEYLGDPKYKVGSKGRWRTYYSKGGEDEVHENSCGKEMRWMRDSYG